MPSANGVLVVVSVLSLLSVGSICDAVSTNTDSTGNNRLRSNIHHRITSQLRRGRMSAISRSGVRAACNTHNNHCVSCLREDTPTKCEYVPTSGECRANPGGKPLDGAVRALNACDPALFHNDCIGCLNARKTASKAPVRIFRRSSRFVPGAGDCLELPRGDTSIEPATQGTDMQTPDDCDDHTKPVVLPLTKEMSLAASTHFGELKSLMTCGTSSEPVYVVKVSSLTLSEDGTSGTITIARITETGIDPSLFLSGDHALTAHEFCIKTGIYHQLESSLPKTLKTVPKCPNDLVDDLNAYYQKIPVSCMGLWESQTFAIDDTRSGSKSQFPVVIIVTYEPQRLLKLVSQRPTQEYKKSIKLLAVRPTPLQQARYLMKIFYDRRSSEYPLIAWSSGSPVPRLLGEVVSVDDNRFVIHGPPKHLMLSDGQPRPIRIKRSSKFDLFSHYYEWVFPAPNPETQLVELNTLDVQFMQLIPVFDQPHGIVVDELGGSSSSTGGGSGGGCNQCHLSQRIIEFWTVSEFKGLQALRLVIPQLYAKHVVKIFQKRKNFMSVEHSYNSQLQNYDRSRSKDKQLPITVVSPQRKKRNARRHTPDEISIANALFTLDIYVDTSNLNSFRLLKDMNANEYPFDLLTKSKHWNEWRINVIELFTWKNVPSEEELIERRNEWLMHYVPNEEMIPCLSHSSLSWGLKTDFTWVNSEDMLIVDSDQIPTGVVIRVNNQLHILSYQDSKFTFNSDPFTCDSDCSNVLTVSPSFIGERNAYQLISHSLIHPFLLMDDRAGKIIAAVTRSVNEFLTSKLMLRGEIRFPKAFRRALIGEHDPDSHWAKNQRFPIWYAKELLSVASLELEKSPYTTEAARLLYALMVDAQRVMYESILIESRVVTFMNTVFTSGIHHRIPSPVSLTPPSSVTPEKKPSKKKKAKPAMLLPNDHLTELSGYSGHIHMNSDSHSHSHSGGSTLTPSISLTVPKQETTSDHTTISIVSSTIVSELPEKRGKKQDHAISHSFHSVWHIVFEKARTVKDIRSRYIRRALQLVEPHSGVHQLFDQVIYQFHFSCGELFTDEIRFDPELHSSRSDLIAKIWHILLDSMLNPATDHLPSGFDDLNGIQILPQELESLFEKFFPSVILSAFDYTALWRMTAFSDLMFQYNDYENLSDQKLQSEFFELVYCLHAIASDPDSIHELAQIVANRNIPRPPGDWNVRWNDQILSHMIPKM